MEGSIGCDLTDKYHTSDDWDVLEDRLRERLIPILFEATNSRTYIMEIRPDGPVKIGKANNVQERLNMGLAFNDQLRVLADYPNQDDTNEKELHRYFAKYSLGRELFEGEPVREWIRTRSLNVSQ